jgi:hypothetical protein
MVWCRDIGFSRLCSYVLSHITCSGGVVVWSLLLRFTLNSDMSLHEYYELFLLHYTELTVNRLGILLGVSGVTQTQIESHQPCQILSNAKENILAQWIIQQASIDFPVTPALIKETAQEIVTQYYNTTPKDDDIQQPIIGHK